MSISRNELYKAINSCLKPVKENIAEVDKRVQSIMSQLDQIEVRVRILAPNLIPLKNQLRKR